ncbi:MAG: helix-turn-helix domain-containing protein [Candidatus Curtissbacteria bacterium]|nr:helix-turn-helix domain-containing protein [Candidatus Curtissbacteria bacterium]
MAKSLEKIEALSLRRNGFSMKEISRKVGVSKSTASRWCRDIVLTEEQMRQLAKRLNMNSLVGSYKGARVQKERRLKLIESCWQNGISRFSNLSESELFICGVALYWAEGQKKGGVKTTFVNTDPLMIQFILNWFKKFFNLTNADFKFRVDINEMHMKRESVVRKYWENIVGVSENGFSKTSFKKVKNKKVYGNFNEHYGTLRIELVKPARVYYPLIGYIDGLAEAGRRLESWQTTLAA